MCVPENLGGLFKDDSSEEATAQQRPEGTEEESHGKLWGKNIPGRVAGAEALRQERVWCSPGAARPAWLDTAPEDGEQGRRGSNRTWAGSAWSGG